MLISRNQFCAYCSICIRGEQHLQRGIYKQHIRNTIRTHIYIAYEHKYFCEISPPATSWDVCFPVRLMSSDIKTVWVKPMAEDIFPPMFCFSCFFTGGWGKDEA